MNNADCNSPVIEDKVMVKAVVTNETKGTAWSGCGLFFFKIVQHRSVTTVTAR